MYWATHVWIQMNWIDDHRVGKTFDYGEQTPTDIVKTIAESIRVDGW